MSGQHSSVDPETIAKTKQQIRGLVEEIAQLSKSEIEPEKYYAEFLQRTVSALAAVGGAVWIPGDEGELELAYQINLSTALIEQTSPEKASEDAQRHLRLIEHITKIREPKLVPPHSGSGDDQLGNPTRYLLVIAPLCSDERVEGIVEIFQRPEAQPDTQRGYLRFLTQMCDMAGEWLRLQKLRSFRDRQSLWVRADNFARVVHESLDKKITSYAICNEGRRLLECDRVSVAILKGRKCQVEAISGQDTIEKRSNTVAGLSRLASRVVASGEALWYTGSTENLAPQIESALTAYVEESFTKTLAIVPLRKLVSEVQQSEDHEEGRVIEQHQLEGEVIGALIVEQIEHEMPRSLLESRIDLVYSHSARALSNALEHNNLFLMPVWRSLGKATWVLRARTLPKTIAIASIVLIALISLIVFPASFDLEARGTLQPTKKQDVFATVGGVVKVVRVRHGDLVQAGDVLVELDNTDLDVQLTELWGQHQSVQEQLRATLLPLDASSRLTPAERHQSLGQRALLEYRRASIKKQIDLLELKKENLKVKSPISGRVVTWSTHETLMHRPVHEGDVLLSVVDPDNQWELAIYMPENRMGHLNNAFDTIADDEKLNVTYIMATDPSRSLTGDVKRGDVHGVAELHDDDGNSVKIRVNIEKKDLVDPRPGATVIADVHCGWRPIGYVWFHEGYEWIQKTLFYYL